VASLETKFFEKTGFLWIFYDDGEYNMMKNLALTLSTMIFILSSGTSHSFDLFDPNRGKSPPQPVIQKPSKRLPTPFKQSSKPPPRPTPSKLKPQKDFTLLGTIRIGDKRTVILKGPDNKEISQRFKNNERTAIKNYDGYYLLSVKARQIQIEYPEVAPCRKDNEKKGLVCDDDGIATLTLKQRKALPPKKKQTQPPKTTKTAAQKRAEARKKREEARKKRKKAPKDFKRKVIKDEDVPPGMRVVHTPFGDRLVPIK
jgi:hypothetical protein